MLSQMTWKIKVGCRFAKLDWRVLLDARAEMYIVVVAEMSAIFGPCSASQSRYHTQRSNKRIITTKNNNDEMCISCFTDWQTKRLWAIRAPSRWRRICLPYSTRASSISKKNALQSVHLKNCKQVQVLRMLRQTMSSPDDVHGEASNKSFWGQHKLFQNIV